MRRRTAANSVGENFLVIVFISTHEKWGRLSRPRKQLTTLACSSIARHAQTCLHVEILEALVARLEQHPKRLHSVGDVVCFDVTLSAKIHRLD